MSGFFQGKAEFRQPHAFRNLEEVYPDGQPLPRIDDSDRIEFFESQRFRTGAKGKKKDPDPPRVDAEKEAFAEVGRVLLKAQEIIWEERDVAAALTATKSEKIALVKEMVDNRLMLAKGGMARASINVIPEGGIDAEPAEDADVEVVGVSKKDPAKKQVKVKVEPEEVIEPEPESDVDSVDDDTEETQVLDAALKTLPKIK